MNSLRRRMVERDRNEAHRASTPLELFFDLAVVVAVSACATGLHHALVDGHVLEGVVRYGIVFFSIWWAWVNFTWFASAYDTDDVPMRFMTMVQMAGVLVLAAGVPRVFAHGDFTVAVVGYVVMRVALVGQWVRAQHESGDPLGICRRYWTSILVIQVLWVVRLWLPPAASWPALFVLVAAEFAVPWYAERGTPGSSWHPAHIAERYGLFVIITCGEVILSASNSFAAALEGGLTGPLLMVAIGGILIVFSLWWFYFSHDSDADLRRRGPWGWAYAHFLVFASVAATGAGIEVMVDRARDEAHLSMIGTDLVLAGSVAVYLVMLGYVHHVVARNRVGVITSWAVAVLVLVVGLLGRDPGWTTLALGLLLTASLGVVLWRDGLGDPGARSGQVSGAAATR